MKTLQLKSYTKYEADHDLSEVLKQNIKTIGPKNILVCRPGLKVKTDVKRDDKIKSAQFSTSTTLDSNKH